MGSPGGNPFSPEAQPHNRWLSFAVCLFLALAVWAVFGRTIHYEFINLDDDLNVYENPAIIHGLSWQGVIWVFTHKQAELWNPLTSLSFMQDCQFHGLNPGGYHLTNVLLHTATVILLFLVLRKMTGVFWPAAFVAAVFAIHPLRVESVAWVTERKDVLSGLFFMLTLWAYVRYGQEQADARRREPESGNTGFFLRSSSYWLALLFFALGLLSKAMLVTMPFVLLLLDYWPLGRMTSLRQDSARPEGNRSQTTRLELAVPQIPVLKSLLWEKVPFLLLTVAVCVATVLAQSNAIGSVEDFDLPSRIGNALVSYADYLGQMFYPVGLAVFYPHPRDRLPAWNVVLSVLVLLMISAGVMAGQRKRPYLLVGWLWYLGMLVPVIGFVQAGSQARADRFTYLPQIGLYIMAAWGAMELCGAMRYRRAVLGSAAGVILAGLLGGAYVQTGYWKDSVSLWMHSLACTSESSLARNNLGNALANQGKLTEAIQQYERALQLKPDYAEAHNNLGDALAAQGKLTEAIQQYERALQIKPDNACALINLGSALAGQGKLTEAIQQYERALQIKPDYAEALNNLGNVLSLQEKLTEAIQYYERALQIKPDYADAHINLGNVLARQGKLTEATQHFQQALTLATAQGNTTLAETIRARLKSSPPALPQPQKP
jgi:tetratricopeptide (TPR) repeat protein